MSAPSAVPIPVAPSADELPRRVLYAINAGLGGGGLDLVARESLAAAEGGGFLGRALVYGRRGDAGRAGSATPPERVRSLRWHPVRLLSGLGRPYYYAAKKRALAAAAARELASGRYDFFHGWAGDCLEALRTARARGLPSMVEIPTWHVDHGYGRWSEEPPPPSPRHWAARLLPARQRARWWVSASRIRAEYGLADLLLTRSARAAESFLAEGFSPDQLFPVGDAADPVRFRPDPAARPDDGIFRALFVGALIRRKGVDLLLEAWQRLALPRAELVLVGHVHDEIRPALARYAPAGGSVRVVGPSARVEDHYRRATVHVFPSWCEGCAKSTVEAAACGLPQVTTRESGDVVVDGVNGLVVPAGDEPALRAALAACYQLDPERRREMGAAARRRVLEQFTWDHFRARLLAAYRQAVRRHRAGAGAAGPPRA